MSKHGHPIGIRLGLHSQDWLLSLVSIDRPLLQYLSMFLLRWFEGFCLRNKFFLHKLIVIDWLDTCLFLYISYFCNFIKLYTARRRRRTKRRRRLRFHFSKMISGRFFWFWILFAKRKDFRGLNFSLYNTNVFRLRKIKPPFAFFQKRFLHNPLVSTKRRLFTQDQLVHNDLVTTYFDSFLLKKIDLLSRQQRKRRKRKNVSYFHLLLSAYRYFSIKKIKLGKLNPANSRLKLKLLKKKKRKNKKRKKLIYNQQTGLYAVDRLIRRNVLFQNKVFTKLARGIVYRQSMAFRIGLIDFYDARYLVKKRILRKKRKMSPLLKVKKKTKKVVAKIKPFTLPAKKFKNKKFDRKRKFIKKRVIPAFLVKKNIWNLRLYKERFRKKLRKVRKRRKRSKLGYFHKATHIAKLNSFYFSRGFVVRWYWYRIVQLRLKTYFENTFLTLFKKFRIFPRLLLSNVFETFFVKAKLRTHIGETSFAGLARVLFHDLRNYAKYKFFNNFVFLSLVIVITKTANLLFNWIVMHLRVIRKHTFSINQSRFFVLVYKTIVQANILVGQLQLFRMRVNGKLNGVLRTKRRIYSWGVQVQRNFLNFRFNYAAGAVPTFTGLLGVSIWLI